MCEKIWSNCPIFNFKIAKVLKKVLKFLFTYLVKIGKKSWHYLYENVCAEADLTSIVINQEGVDVVRWSVFHEPRSPDLDDEQVSRNQEQCGPKTIQHKPTIDPFISQIPQAIRPLIKVSRNVHSIFHHVPQIRSTCFLVANFFLPFLPGLWKLNFLTRIGKELRFCAGFSSVDVGQRDKTTKNKLSRN